MPMPFASNHISRLVQHWRESGMHGVATLIGKNLPAPFQEWRVRRLLLQHERFDSKYGVDTQMPVALADLETNAPGARFANRYQGTPIAFLHRLIRRLEINRERFTFIDLGSGKGRVLLIAGQYPFKAVIGVEFSKTLHDIALRNIGKFRSAGASRTDLTSINMDAEEFDFSRFTDKLVFCYNSFGAGLMIRVLDNLEISTKGPGETVFAYLGAMPGDVEQRLKRFPIIERAEVLTEFDTYERYSIYRMIPQN
ncbi:MAG: class I SAM-dependent methyltransferase [Alphaproteobacteria bacterium]|nr:class I SAM-dependent methyltransferase [Alphaproteobacteria bacterium]